MAVKKQMNAAQVKAQPYAVRPRPAMSAAQLKARPHSTPASRADLAYYGMSRDRANLRSDAASRADLAYYGMSRDRPNSRFDALGRDFQRKFDAMAASNLRSMPRPPMAKRRK